MAVNYVMVNGNAERTITPKGSRIDKIIANGTLVYQREQALPDVGMPNWGSVGPGTGNYSQVYYGDWFTIDGFDTLTGTVTLALHIEWTSSYGMGGGAYVFLQGDAGQWAQIGYANSGSNSGGTWYTSTAINYNISGRTGRYRIGVQAYNKRENTDLAATGWTRTSATNLVLR